MSKSAQTWLFNILGIVLHTLAIAWLRQYVPLVEVFAQAHFIAQCFIAFVLVFFAFVFLMMLKRAILKDGKITQSEKRKWYSGAIPFVVVDVDLNINAAPLLFWQLANAHGEGWTFTSRINWHIEQVAVYGKPPTWRFHLAHWFCRLLSTADKFHCHAMRALKAR